MTGEEVQAMRWKYILFDMDGTLTESAAGISKGVRLAFHAVGKKEPSNKEINIFLGPPLKESFSKCGMSEKEIEKAVEVYRRYYDEIGVYENQLYPGITGMLERVYASGRTLIVATSKPYKATQRIMSFFNLSMYFDIVVCGTTDGARSTKKGVITEALKEIAKNKSIPLENVREKSVMIGDRKNDIEGAQNNGISSIGVSWGYAEKGELEDVGANIIIGDAKSLCSQLLTSS